MKKINVSLGKRSYPILIGRGLASEIGKYLKRLRAGKKVFIVTHQQVAVKSGLLRQVHKSLHRAGFETSNYILPYGSEHDKSEQGLELLWKAMLHQDLDRSSTALALGGGVVGDVAGFAASTYMRGINLVHMPTTLLAQVDSAIGGKTAIDLTGGKNIVGTFYQPKLVVSDLNALKSLPPAAFRDSFAEVIKYGIIRDPKLFSLLENKGLLLLTHAKEGALTTEDFSLLENIVFRCAKIKASIVIKDEFETKGLRVILNYGHTFAHALEGVSGYRISHGEAVGLGMVLAGILAQKLKLVDTDFVARQQKLIQEMGLSTSLKPYAKRFRLSWLKVRSFFRHDKKTVGGIVRFVLPTRLGQVKVVGIEGEKWYHVRDSFLALGVH